MALTRFYLASDDQNLQNLYNLVDSTVLTYPIPQQRLYQFETFRACIFWPRPYFCRNMRTFIVGFVAVLSCIAMIGATPVGSRSPVEAVEAPSTDPQGPPCIFPGFPPFCSSS